MGVFFSVRCMFLGFFCLFFYSFLSLFFGGWGFFWGFLLVLYCYMFLVCFVWGCVLLFCFFLLLFFCFFIVLYERQTCLNKINQIRTFPSDNCIVKRLCVRNLVIVRFCVKLDSYE